LELERLLAGQLRDVEEQALEAHVAGCEQCQHRLDALTECRRSFSARLSDLNGNEEELPPGAGVLARLSDSSSPRKRPAELASPENQPEALRIGRSFSGSSAVRASGRFIRRQTWLWPLIAAALICGAGWWVNRSVESAMRDQRVNELTTILEADITALRSWMDSQRVTAELIAAGERLEPLAQELLALLDDQSDVRNRLALSPAQAAIRSRLIEPLRKGGYIGFILVSPSGVAVAVDEDAAVGTAMSGYRGAFFDRVIHVEATVSRPFLSPILLPDSKGELRASQPCMYAAAPIRDGSGRPIAALGLRIRPDDQFTRILQVARSGKSGETYAFDRNGVLLSQSRFDEQLRQMGLLVDRPETHAVLNVELRDPGVNMVEGRRPNSRRADQPLTRMAKEATQGLSGHDVEGYRDYRGVPVVGAWRWLDEYDFGVATEIDVAEAFAPVYVLRRAFAVLLSLLAVTALGIVLAMLLIARQRRELHEATLVAEQFGQYRLVEKIGTGGMGTVYRARHALLRRPTAIKLLNAEMISETTIARFEREVQLTAGLTHPNTVAIYDYGRTSGGIFYYAMEYLEGVNLDELVKHHGPLPEARAVYILRQICASLAEAHAAGLIHRDIKPANVFLTRRGGQYDFVKVLDFGLARSSDDRREPILTSTNIVAGTPLYVSPEAVTHPDRVNSRADVYAIGAVGYFLVTGSPVFAGSSSADICLRHVWSTPERPSDRCGRAINPELEALLLDCLAKSPLDRPADAAVLLHGLEGCSVPGCWTAADAARWWSNREHSHAASTSAAEFV
jgi:hypothetical protein